jgi:CBS domain containing-hemolysin-like protein
VVIEWVLLAASVVLVVACGVFVAAEFSFVTADRGAVDRAAAAGDRSARGVQAALRSLSTQLSGAQVGITLTNLAIGFLAEPAIAALLETPLTAAGLPAALVPGTAVTAGLVLATVGTMVFGELVPKNLAIADPLKTARATQGFQRGFTAVMSYPIRVLNGSANALVRRLGVEPQEELRSARTSAEVVSLVRRSASEGTLDVTTAGLMQRSIAFTDRTADEIMTPRVRLATVSAHQPVTAVFELARTSGHSRFPVVTADTDEVVGAVHVKQAIAVPREHRRTTRVTDVMVEVMTVPATLRLDPLLAQLRGNGFQVAVVADEYGGTAGVVTLEDVVEELVGEISDEHDPLDARARRRADGSWSVSGLLRPDEVSSLTGIALPEHEDYDTVAGLVLRSLGRMAVVGDSVTVPLPVTLQDDGDPAPQQVAVLEVERLTGLRIDRTRLSRRERHPADDLTSGRHRPRRDEAGSG